MAANIIVAIFRKNVYSRTLKKKTHKELKEFYQLVENSHLLWPPSNQSHGSTTGYSLMKLPTTTHMNLLMGDEGGKGGLEGSSVSGLGSSENSQNIRCHVLSCESRLHDMVIVWHFGTKKWMADGIMGTLTVI